MNHKQNQFNSLQYLDIQKYLENEYYIAKSRRREGKMTFLR